MDLKSYINECKKHWRLFAATLTTTLIAAILFLLMFAPRYERSATVLIKDENGGGGLLSSMSANIVPPLWVSPIFASDKQESTRDDEES